jgi:polysaccharide biosynthesis protein PslF
MSDILRHRHVTPLKIGMLSTYPPTICGLATFSAALSGALRTLGHRVDVVRVDDGTADAQPGGQVSAVLRSGSASSVRRTAQVLSDCDVAIVQHEFGIFGGRDGEEVLDVMRAVDAPLIVVLHTVQQQGSAHQADLMVEICDIADRVVVMSASARERLVATYFPIDDRKVVTIPHGATLATQVQSGAWREPNPKAQILTWGLLGPGKGIENVIDAVGLLFGLGHPVRYTVAGTTHPKVLAREGHRYLDQLNARVDALGIRHLVTFDDEYRGVRELTEFVASAGVVVLPYDTVEQVTSGVLVDSIAAGRPVVSTRFPHAVELLSDGAGLLVPQHDPTSMALAVRRATGNPELIASMEDRARALAPTLSWASVARSYASECRDMTGARQRLTA